MTLKLVSTKTLRWQAIATLALWTAVHTASAAEGDFYVPGAFQAWTPSAADRMTETAPGSGIYTLDIFGLVTGEKYKFKILENVDGGDVTWDDVQITPEDSWFYGDDDGVTTIQLNTNTASDDFVPTINRIVISDDIDTWNAVGNFMVEAGGSGDWNNGDPLFAMSDQGNGLFSLTTTIATAGTYEWRAVNTGTWEGIGVDQRRDDNATNDSLTIFKDNQEITLSVDTSLGAIGWSTEEVLKGDTNGNFIIELEPDFGPIRDNYLTNTFIRTEGDLVSDGIVNVDDFRQWKNACIAAGCATESEIAVAAASLGAVPEPNSMALALLCSGGLLCLLRKWKANTAMKSKLIKASSCANALTLAILVSCVPTLAHGQDNAIWTGTIGDWNQGSNWDVGGVPTVLVDDAAIINNGGVANVDEAIGDQSPTVRLGDGGGNSGTLNVNGPNGSLSTAIVGGGSNGNVEVGLNGGTGMLNIGSGGTLTVAGELRSDTNANAASTISIADGGTLAAASGFVDRTLILTGPGASLSTTGNLTLGQAGTHTWQIPATGAPILDVGSQLDLGGTLRLEFPGQTPAVGSSWTLADSATVVNGFGNMDTSAISGLGNGERFLISTTPGGTHGQLTRVTLEQHPVLTVDRQSGRVTMSNPGATTTVNFDAYTIGSSLGALNPTKWQSLQGNSVANWVEANPTSSTLSELAPLNSSTLAAGESFDLGTPFELPLPTQLGEQTEDITFQFAANDGGYIDGEVRYTGAPNNNVVLNVNPVTGETHLWNPTSFTVDFDAYTISSESNSLRFADGTWESLQDQSADNGTWNEANPDTEFLSELQSVGETTLSPGTTFELGTAFDTSGKQDLAFEFALAGQEGYREGLVIYGEFSAGPGVAGDYNANGQVEQGDLDLVLLNWGADWPPAIDGWINQQPIDDGKVDQNDLDNVLLNWGDTAVAVSAAAVPEPASGLMLFGLVILPLTARYSGTETRTSQAKRYSGSARS